MTFEEFEKIEPKAAEAFARLCFADDGQLVKLGVLDAIRASLHSETLWSYEQAGAVWRASGSWGEVWECDGTAWRCVQERPWRFRDEKTP